MSDKIYEDGDQEDKIIEVDGFDYDLLVRYNKLLATHLRLAHVYGDLYKRMKRCKCGA